MYEKYHGPIPEGMQACHRCDVQICVNPDHIFVGTNADNCHDRKVKGRNPDRRGEKHHLAKLTAAQIDEIRRSTKLQRELAAEYGVWQSCISRIKSGERW